MGRRGLELVAAALFPPRCVLCQRTLPSLEVVCAECAALLPGFEGPRCSQCGDVVSNPALDLCLRCGTRFREVDRVLPLGPYAGAWGRLVRTLKFEREPAVGRWLGERMAERVLADGGSCAFDVVTFVPMMRSDRLDRGFNQAEILARTAAARLHLPVRRLLTKCRPTLAQSRLSAADREANLRDAFRALPCEHLRVLLVDDIYTTGSTVEECAQALKQGGASRVVAMTVARA